MKWLHHVYTPLPLLQLLYLLQQRGVGSPPSPQASWITHFGLIPFTLSVLSVSPTCAGPLCGQVTHTRTQAQVPVFDKDYVDALASSAQAHHIMGNRISSHDLQVALISTTCAKALNPCVTTRPQTALCQGSSSDVHTGADEPLSQKFSGHGKIMKQRKKGGTATSC